MELKDTCELMTSADYKDRFKAEYHQLKTRINNLEKMLSDWDAGQLNFQPTCEREMYGKQLTVMNDYLIILTLRAIEEHINIDVNA